MSGFPNFFVLYGPNTNLGGNSIIYMLEGQIGYTLAAIKALESERLAWLDVRPDVQDTFNSWVQKVEPQSVWMTGCHSWYTTATGRNTNNWPGYTFMYRYRIRRFDPAAYRVMPQPPGAGMSEPEARCAGMSEATREGGQAPRGLSGIHCAYRPRSCAWAPGSWAGAAWTRSWPGRCSGPGWIS